MNSTKWYTLTEFVQHLSKTGQVRADLTDKGWFISVIQPDPEEKLAEERRHKRDRAERVSTPMCNITTHLSCEALLHIFRSDVVTGMQRGRNAGLMLSQ